MGDPKQSSRRSGLGKPVFYLFFVLVLALVPIGLLTSAIRSRPKAIKEDKQQRYDDPEGAFSVTLPAGLRVRTEQQRVPTRGDVSVSLSVHKTESFVFCWRRDRLVFGIVVWSVSGPSRREWLTRVQFENLVLDVMGQAARVSEVSDQTKVTRKDGVVTRARMTTYAGDKPQRVLIEIHMSGERAFVLVVEGIPGIPETSPAVETFFASFVPYKTRSDR